MQIGQQYNPHMMFVGSFIPNYIMIRKDLTATDKLLFARLSQYAGKSGECYPKQETIAEELGCSQSAVKLSIKRLVEMKLIKVIKPVGSERLHHMHDKYVFLWSEIFEDSPTVRNELSDRLEIDSPIKENHIKENHLKYKAVSEIQSVKNPIFHNIINQKTITRSDQIAEYFFREFSEQKGLHPEVSDRQMIVGLKNIDDFLKDHEDSDIIIFIRDFFQSKVLKNSGADFRWNLFTDKKILEARCRERWE